MSLCPICREPPTRPAALSCGHVLCRSCIRLDLAGSTQCAVCRSTSTLALERVYYSFERECPLPECNAAAVLAAILRNIREGNIEAAARHWRTFVVYSTSRDPGFSALLVRSTTHPMTFSPHPAGGYDPSLPFAPGNVLSDLGTTSHWIGRFAGSYPEESVSGISSQSPDRTRWLHLSSEIIQAYGVGVEIWRNAGVERMMLEALGFGQDENSKDDLADEEELSTDKDVSMRDATRDDTRDDTRDASGGESPSEEGEEADEEESLSVGERQAQVVQRASRAAAYAAAQRQDAQRQAELNRLAAESLDDLRHAGLLYQSQGQGQR